MSFNAQGNPKYTLENIKNKKFILHHHLGLGDHFVFNGMVNYISKQYDKIYIPAKYTTIQQLNLCLKKIIK